MSFPLDGLKKFVQSAQQFGYVFEVKDSNADSLAVTSPGGPQIHYRIISIFQGCLLGLETGVTQILRGVSLMLRGITNLNKNHFFLGVADLCAGVIQMIALPILGILSVVIPQWTAQKTARFVLKHDYLLQNVQKLNDMSDTEGLNILFSSIKMDSPSEGFIAELKGSLWNFELYLENNTPDGQLFPSLWIKISHKIQAFIFTVFAIPAGIVQVVTNFLRGAMTCHWKMWNAPFAIEGIGHEYSENFVEQLRKSNKMGLDPFVQRPFVQQSAPSTNSVPAFGDLPPSRKNTHLIEDPD